MNLLITTSNLAYPGGTEQFLRGYTRHLLGKKGISVSLYENYDHGWKGDDSIYHDLVAKGLKVFTTSEKPSYDFYNLRRVSELAKITKDNQVDAVHSFLFNPDFTVFMGKYSPNFVFGQFSEAGGFDELLSLYPEMGKMKDAEISNNQYKWISSKFCSFSVALEFDTDEWRTRKKIIDEQVEPIMSRYTDKVTGVSKNICAKWEKFIGKKVELTPCCSIGFEDIPLIGALKDRSVELKEKYGLNSNAKIYICVSRMALGKGIEDLVDAFTIHVREHSNDTLLLVGDGEQEYSYRARANQSRNIKFLGYKNRSEIFELLSISDFFCLFSHSEGLSLSVQEGMAFGLPVLSTDVGGLTDLVTERNGRTCKAGDVNQIVSLLQWSTTISQEERREFGINSSNLIKEKYLKEDVYEQLINITSTCVGS